MDWLEFMAAFAAFFLTHSIPLRPAVRPRLQRALGRRGFTLAYSILSLSVLGWLIAAAGRVPFVPIWTWAPWQLLVPLVVMLPVCLILSLATARPNPFSFGGTRNETFDPARPGIVRLNRHPLLLALALWATAHVVPNGDLAHVILFGQWFRSPWTTPDRPPQAASDGQGLEYFGRKGQRRGTPVVAAAAPCDGFGPLSAADRCTPAPFGVSPLP